MALAAFEKEALFPRSQLVDFTRDVTRVLENPEMAAKFIDSPMTTSPRQLPEVSAAANRSWELTRLSALRNYQFGLIGLSDLKN